MSERRLVDLLKTRFPDASFTLAAQNANPALHVESAYLGQVAEFLRDEPETRYDLLLTAARAPQQIHYQLGSLSHRRRLRLCVNTSPAPDSLALVWPAANWSERRARDLWGIEFNGHPDPRPLLKKASTQDERGQAWTRWEIGSRCPTSLEGWHIDIEQRQARVAGIRVEFGDRHIGLENKLTQWPYHRAILLTARMDGFSAMQTDLVYALGIEKLLGVTPPRRARQLRVIYAELQRIASHLYWLARCVQNLYGANLAVISYLWQGRQTILDFFQRLGGNPITPDIIAIGGLARDLDAGLSPAALLPPLDTLLVDIDRLLTSSSEFRSHWKDIGVIDPGTALGLGATGPCLRATGVSYDVRRALPYSGYDELDVPVITAQSGDAWARYLVHVAEIEASLRLIRQTLTQLKQGEVNHFALPRQPALPQTLPAGAIYAAIESARGELGIYLCANGADRLQYAHIRAPSLANLSMLPLIAAGTPAARLPLILDSLDISIAGAAQ